MMRTCFRLTALAFLAASSMVACKAKVGAACKNAKEATCEDATAALVCNDKVWTKLSCNGPNGCKSEGTSVECDESLAVVGEFCDREDNVSCASDKHAQLRCERGQWRLDAVCRGPEGCTTTSDSVRCDDTVALVEDRCLRDGHHTCSADRTAVLVCRSRGFVLAEACRAPTCSIRGATAGCGN